jgi:hypothetical protein
LKHISYEKIADVIMAKLVGYVVHSRPAICGYAGLPGQTGNVPFLAIEYQLIPFQRLNQGVHIQTS